MPSAALDVIRPAFLWTPPSAVGSLGDEVAELAEDLGQEVREEERIALRALTPMGADGLPAGLEGCIICGRQQLKSWSIEMCLIHDGWERKVGRQLWSAHQTKTSDDNFTHLIELIAAYDWLSKRTRNIYGGNGNHKIVFADKLTTYPTLGGTRAGKQKQDRTIEFGARENGPTGRGRTKINRLILDEWLYGSAAMAGAQIPTMATVHDAYVRYGSSPGKLNSAALRTLRERGRPGGDPSLSYAEWTAERIDANGRRVLPTCVEPECSHMVGLVEGCFLDDVEVIRATNPAYGTSRLTPDWVEKERRSLTPVEFARERAGIWEDPPEDEDHQGLFPLWSERAVPDVGPVPGARVALGIDTSWSREKTYVAVATEIPGGVRAQIVASGPGTGWVADWLFGVRGSPEPSRMATLAPVAVGMHASSAPVATVLDDLRLRVPEGTEDRLVPFSAGDMANACGVLFDLVKSEGFGYVSCPELERAVAGAVGKPLGAAWAIDRVRSKGDAAPLVAVSVAVAALVGAAEEPAKPPPNCW